MKATRRATKTNKLLPIPPSRAKRSKVYPDCWVCGVYFRTCKEALAFAAKHQPRRDKEQLVAAVIAFDDQSAVIESDTALITVEMTVKAYNQLYSAIDAAATGGRGGE